MKKILSLLLAMAMLISIGAVAGAAEIAPAADFSPDYVVDLDLSSDDIAAPEAWGATPSDAQRYYQQQGLAAFCHFGPNTFQNVEWGQSYGNRTPDDLFKLQDDFDADNIVKMLKEAGFSRLLLTCKHHDGFAIWDCSAVYEDFGLEPYTIAQTDYKGGKGDILEELSDACTKYNMDMGIYLSPWDIHAQNVGVFGSTKKTDGTDVDKNSSGQYMTYQNKYNDFYVAQIESILYAVKTDENGQPLKNEDGSPVYKYGNNNPDRRGDRFVEWWMDGATGEGTAAQYYDWKRITDAVHADSPDCQFFGTTGAAGNDNTDGKIFKNYAGTGGIHWIGNESGLASSTTWSKLNKGVDITRVNTEGINAVQGVYNGTEWSVPECDAKILSSGWFWGPGKQSSLQSMSALANMYFRSVGNGATLLLNASPNTNGTLDTNQYNRFVEFGEAIKQTFGTDYTKAEGVTAAASSVYGKNIAYSASNVIDKIPDGEQYDETYWAPEAGQTTGSIEIDFGHAVTFDVVSLEEYIPLGQRISQFSIEYRNVAGVWRTFDDGTTIGAKKLVRAPAVTATAIRVNIEASYELPMISNVGVYKAVEAFEVAASSTGNSLFPTELSNYDYIPNTESVKTGEWKSNGGTNTWSNAEGASQTYTVTGSQIAVLANLDPGHSAMKITIDGEEVAVVDTMAADRATEQIVYVSEELPYGQHTVVLTTTKLSNNTKTCNDIHGLYVYNNDGKGIISVEKKEYRTPSASSQKIKIIRQYGSVGEVTVAYATATGSAEQNVGYVYQDGTVTFADGETEKEIVVNTLYHPERGNDVALYFYFIIYSAGDDSAVFGENVDPQVFIEPIDIETKAEELQDYVDNLNIKSGAYERESYRLYKQRLLEAKNVLANEKATGIEIGSALRALEMAIENLSTGEELIPQSQLTASAPSSHNGTGPELAIDGKSDTWWHSAWAADGNLPNFTTDDRNYIILTLKSAQDVVKLSYLPRTDSSPNGIITQYEILYSTSDSDEDWQLVSSGNWENDHTEKETDTFLAPNAKRIMLRVKAAASDSNNSFMSASEINLYTSSLSEPYSKSELGGIAANAEDMLKTVQSETKAAAIEAAVAAAAKVIDDPNATQDDIDDAIAQIDVAVAMRDIEPEPEPEVTLGDVTKDGAITSLDATVVLQYAAGIVDKTDERYDYGAADVSGDGAVTSLDATYILQHAAGLLPNGFPGA